MPVGVLLSILGIVYGSVAPSTSETIKDSGSGALLCPADLFVVGMIVVAPIVAGLRCIGYAVPFSVCSISVVFGMIAMADDVRFGTIALIVGLKAGCVFRRYAYCDTAALTDLGKAVQEILIG